VRCRLSARGIAGEGAAAGVAFRGAGLMATLGIETAIACCAPLGDAARVRIVNLLATSSEPVCACELYEPLGLSQPTVSHHLKKLVEAGLLDREQRGKWAYFSLRRDAVETLAAVADLKGVCC
jgi:ArsR family transcriptional regulator, arsenate/arsenite/antimonite-responsive transcriptional repressor